MSRAKDEMGAPRSIESLTARTVLIAAPFLGLASGIVAGYWYGTGSDVLLGAVLAPMCLGFATYVRGVRNGRMAFATGFLWEAAGAGTTLVAVSVLLYAGNYEHVLLGLCLGYVVAACAGWPWHRSTRLPAEDRTQIVGYTVWTSVQAVAAGGLLPAVTALAALHASPAEMGDLGAAVSIATPVLLLSIALRTSSAPFVARRVARGDFTGLRQSTDSLLRTMVTIFVPTFGVACLWAPDLLALLYGDTFATGSTLLVLLLLGVSINCLNASHIWLSAGPPWGPRALALCNGSGLVVGVVVAAVGVGFAPTSGAAAGYLVGSLVSTTLATLIVWREGRMEWFAVSARLVAGYTLVVGSLVIVGSAGTGIRLIVTLVFTLSFAALSLDDLRRLRRALRASAGPMP
jgi:O-antigen/teichoic acid export membrane protein